MRKTLPVVPFVAAIIVLTLSLAGCNVSTANLSDVKIFDKIEDGRCSSDMGTIDKSVDTFHVTANLNNAPSGTKVKIDWRYLSGELSNEPQDIDSVSVVSEENSDFVESSLERATPAWPKGEYEAVLKIDTDNADPIHKKFSVK